MAKLLQNLGNALANLAPPARESISTSANSSSGLTPSGGSSSYLGPHERDTRSTRVRLPEGGGALERRASSEYSDDVAPGEQPRLGDVVLPRVVWGFEPKVVLKLRKRFHPLGITRLTVGADMDLQSKDIALKWSWKDRVLGGRLRFEGSQLSLSKRLNIDSNTHMYLRCAYDVHARRTLFSVDVRPFKGLYTNDGKPGFAFKQKLPLDKNVAVEVAARVQLPEARFSTQNTVSLGEGDFIVDVEQVNFRFMLQ